MLHHELVEVGVNLGPPSRRELPWLVVSRKGLAVFFGPNPVPWTHLGCVQGDRKIPSVSKTCHLLDFFPLLIVSLARNVFVFLPPSLPRKSPFIFGGQDEAPPIWGRLPNPLSLGLWVLQGCAIDGFLISLPTNTLTCDLHGASAQ